MHVLYQRESDLAINRYPVLLVGLQFTLKEGTNQSTRYIVQVNRDRLLDRNRYAEV
jgi:hypothetical protein